MALIKCTECATEMSAKADKCPKCGHPNAKAKHLAGSQVFIGLMVGVGVIFWMANSGPSASIQQKVSGDLEKQYQIAVQQGEKMQICVQAGIVAASYLQAKDQANYNRWKGVESKDCARAGVPR